MNQLSKYKVRDVMKTEFPTIFVDTDMEDVLRDLVDQSFICITNENQEFLGIVTRKEVLKRINFMVHELTREFDLVEKSKEKAKIFRLLLFCQIGNRWSRKVDSFF